MELAKEVLVIPDEWEDTLAVIDWISYGGIPMGEVITSIRHDEEFFAALHATWLPDTVDAEFKLFTRRVKETKSIEVHFQNDWVNYEELAEMPTELAEELTLRLRDLSSRDLKRLVLRGKKALLQSDETSDLTGFAPTHDSDLFGMDPRLFVENPNLRDFNFSEPWVFPHLEQDTEPQISSFRPTQSLISEVIRASLGQKLEHKAQDPLWSLEALSSLTRESLHWQLFSQSGIQVSLALNSVEFKHEGDDSKVSWDALLAFNVFADELATQMKNRLVSALDTSE